MKIVEEFDVYFVSEGSYLYLKGHSQVRLCHCMLLSSPDKTQRPTKSQLVIQSLLLFVYNDWCWPLKTVNFYASFHVLQMLSGTSSMMRRPSSYRYKTPTLVRALAGSMEGVGKCACLFNSKHCRHTHWTHRQCRHVQKSSAMPHTLTKHPNNGVYVTRYLCHVHVWWKRVSVGWFTAEFMESSQSEWVNALSQRQVIQLKDVRPPYLSFL